MNEYVGGLITESMDIKSVVDGVLEKFK